MKFSFANSCFLLSALFLVAVTLSKPRYLEKHTNATIAWDVSGYYLYLPASIIYGDLKKVKFLPDIIEKYIPSPQADQVYPIENGNKVMKYSAGMAVLYAPSFFLSHLIAKTTDYPADGFSLPYQVGLHWGSVLFAILGLWFLKKILSRYFEEKVTGLTLLLLVAGTNFLNYSTFDAANTHDYLFTLMALLLWSSIRFYETEKWKYAIGAGIFIGLAALTRPTELLYVLIPVLWGLSDLEGLKRRITFLKKNWLKILLAVAIVGAIGSIQLIYWKSVTGHWLEYSYQDQGFSFMRPHFTEVFFSYRKGWFVYTPLMLFAVLGFYFLYKNHKRLFPAIFIFCLINTWIISAWDIWWYGGAFGQRAFVQSYVLLAFPLSAFLVYLQRSHQFIKWTTVALMAACISLNLFQTYQAHWGPFEVEAMNKSFYWRIFGKTKYDPYDRLLLDTNESFTGEKKNLDIIKVESFEHGYDSLRLGRLAAHSGQWSTFIDLGTQFSPGTNLPYTKEMQPGKWVHLKAWFYAPKMNWDYWRMPQLVLRFEKKEVPVKEKIIRPFRVMSPNQWAEIGMNIRIPDETFDNIEIFLWNPAQLDVKLLMDDLEVGVFEK